MSNRTRVINTALLAAAVILCLAVASGLKRRTAEAQMVFQAGPVLVCSGAQVGGNDERPLYLLDTITQCLIVYTYQPQQNYMRLQATRKVLDDLSLTEYSNRGTTVEQVKDMIEKMKKK